MSEPNESNGEVSEALLLLMGAIAKCGWTFAIHKSDIICGMIVGTDAYVGSVLSHIPNQNFVINKPAEETIN